MTRVSVTGSGAPVPRNQPSSHTGVVQYALSVLKANLMSVTSKNVDKCYKIFDIIAFQPELEAVFKLQKSKSEFSIVSQTHEYWDSHIGKRWDVLAGGDYVVHKIVFYKKKISPNAKALSTLKISCQIHLLYYVISAARQDVYRQQILARMDPRAAPATVICFIFIKYKQYSLIIFEF